MTQTFGWGTAEIKGSVLMNEVVEGLQRGRVKNEGYLDRSRNTVLERLRR